MSKEKTKLYNIKLPMTDEQIDHLDWLFAMQDWVTTTDEKGKVTRKKRTKPMLILWILDMYFISKKRSVDEAK